MPISQVEKLRPEESLMTWEAIYINPLASGLPGTRLGSPTDSRWKSKAQDVAMCRNVPVGTTPRPPRPSKGQPLLETNRVAPI